VKSQSARSRVLRLVCLAAWAVLCLRVLPPGAFAASGTANYAKGLAEARAGHYAAAAKDFEQALLDGHTDAGTFYQLGLAYWKLKRLNDADWALVTALGDPNIAKIAPDAVKDVTALQNAGAVDVGPPALLRTVQLTEATPKPISPAVVAAGESQAAVSALQSGTYFVAPLFVTTVNANTVGALSLAAADLQNNSNTVAKFVFLSATPAPFSSLAAYAKELFGHLGLQRAVLVVTTPQQTVAYTDRLDSSTTTSITDQRVRAFHGGSPADLAAAVARTIDQKADAAESAQQVHGVILGSVIVALILAGVAAAIVVILRRQPSTTPLARQTRSRISTRSR
jgi:hypothetical protein